MHKDLLRLRTSSVVNFVPELIENLWKGPKAIEAKERSNILKT